MLSRTALLLLPFLSLTLTDRIYFTQSTGVGGNKMWYTLKFSGGRHDVERIRIICDRASEQHLQGVEVYLDSAWYPDSGRLIGTISVVPGQLQYDITTLANNSPITASSVTLLSYKPPFLTFDKVEIEGEETTNCAWGREHVCDHDTKCSFGCHSDSFSGPKYCWSQCDGACPRTDMTGCHGCKEWCWVEGVGGHDYQTCTTDSDCVGVRMNSCSGTCSI